MGRHNIFLASAPRPSRVRFAVSRAAAIVLVLGVIAWIGLSILFAPPQSSEQLATVDAQASAPTGTPEATQDTAPAQTPSSLTVHVVGAVHHPGVYELAPGARVNDAIEAAGGMQPDARPELVNLASPITDGAQILLPGKDHPAPVAAPTIGPRQGASTAAPADPSGLVNINQADAETLGTLPGIGPALAGRIIDFREANGPFAAVEELQEVSGIGPVLLKRLAELVAVS